MKEKDAPPMIVIAVEVDDPDLSDQLTSVLADLPGVRLAAPGEKADVRLLLRASGSFIFEAPHGAR